VHSIASGRKDVVLRLAIREPAGPELKRFKGASVEWDDAAYTGLRLIFANLDSSSFKIHSAPL